MRIVGAPWFDLSFLKERQLFAKEEILRGQGAVGTGREENKPTQVEQDHGCGEETMKCESRRPSMSSSKTGAPE